MVRTCRQHGIDIYADVVMNHMAGGVLHGPEQQGRAGTPWQYR
jgi:pullulanase/glycogen debranching enzyme